MAKRKNRSSSQQQQNGVAQNKKKQKKSSPIPVTILSGFLGSGKTTLLQNIVTSSNHGLKIAVIVNDMAALNVDGHTIRRVTPTSNKDGDEKTKHVTSTLSNGCICCELRGDLIQELQRIRATNQFDWVIIESTGIAEPQQVAESFCVDPTTMKVASSLSNAENDNGDDQEEETTALFATTARLDTCVTVVDGVEFPKYMTSLQRFKDHFQDGIEEAQEGEAEKSIAELMMEQVEFANVIILNKMDLLTNQQLTTAQELIHQLNPRATIIPTSFGKLEDYSAILNTHAFSMKDAQQSPGWLTSLKDGVTSASGEAEEYGIASHVFRARRPFHPLRLHQFIQHFACLAHTWNALSSQEREEGFTKSTESLQFAQDCGEILRSKGTCWIAGRDHSEMGWAHAGRILQVTPNAPWYCDTPPDEWPEDENERASIEANMMMQGAEDNEDDNRKPTPYPYGDRRQEIVFIGTGLQIPVLEEMLTKCLLTEHEMKQHSLSNLPIGAYPDPFPPQVFTTDMPRNLSMIVRQGQNQHLEVVPDSVVTIHSVALHMKTYEQHADMVLAVKLWWDASDEIEHGTLVATLRPLSCEQYAPSLPILPLEEAEESEQDTIDDSDNEVPIQRLRVQVLKSKACTLSDEELMEAVEVHIQAQVEPLSYASGAEEEGFASTTSDPPEEVQESSSVPTID